MSWPLGQSDAADPVLAFDHAGGDAWTFDKWLTGNVSSNACDEVMLKTPTATAQALVQGERFFAQVPLRSGEMKSRRSARRRSGFRPLRWPLPAISVTRLPILSSCATPSVLTRNSVR